eukprot:SAG11_NODE_1397_length_5032_cov_14.008109_11_plen_32_part_01
MGPLGAGVDVDGRLPTRHDGLDARKDDYDGDD